MDRKSVSRISIASLAELNKVIVQLAKKLEKNIDGIKQSPQSSTVQTALDRLKKVVDDFVRKYKDKPIDQSKIRKAADLKVKAEYLALQAEREKAERSTERAREERALMERRDRERRLREEASRAEEIAAAAREAEIRRRGEAAAEAVRLQDEKRRAEKEAEKAEMRRLAEQLRRDEADFAEIKRDPDLDMLRLALTNTLCLKNYTRPPHFENLRALVERFRSEKYATNEGLLREAIRIRLLDDPFKMYLLQRDLYLPTKEEAQGVKPRLILTPTPDITQIQLTGPDTLDRMGNIATQKEGVVVPNPFNATIYEIPEDGINSESNFRRFKTISKFESSQEKTFMTYGPSGTGKTTIIKQIMKDEASSFRDKMEIRAVMIYALHERSFVELYQHGVIPGFLTFDFYDMVKVIRDPEISGIFTKDSEGQTIIDDTKVTKNDRTIPPKLNAESWQGIYAGPRYTYKEIGKDVARLGVVHQCGYSQINVAPTSQEVDEFRRDMQQDLKTSGFLSDPKKTCDAKFYYNIENYRLKTTPGQTELKELLTPHVINARTRDTVIDTIDQIFATARYRRTKNNHQSSRSILCFFIKYDDNKETTFIDLFGNEEEAAQGLIPINGHVACESAAIIKILEIVQEGLKSLRTGEKDYLDNALRRSKPAIDDAFIYGVTNNPIGMSRSIAATRATRTDDTMFAADRLDTMMNNVEFFKGQEKEGGPKRGGVVDFRTHIETVERNKNLFFNLFKPSAKEQHHQKDFQLLVTAVRDLYVLDKTRIPIQQQNHRTMLELVNRLDKPSKCINKRDAKGLFQKVFEIRIRDEDVDGIEFAKEMGIDSYIDLNNRAESHKPIHVEPPPFNYQLEYTKRKEQIEAEKAYGHRVVDVLPRATGARATGARATGVRATGVRAPTVRPPAAAEAAAAAEFSGLNSSPNEPPKRPSPFSTPDTSPRSSTRPVASPDFSPEGSESKSSSRPGLFERAAGYLGYGNKSASVVPSIPDYEVPSMIQFMNHIAKGEGASSQILEKLKSSDDATKLKSIKNYIDGYGLYSTKPDKQQTYLELRVTSKTPDFEAKFLADPRFMKKPASGTKRDGGRLTRRGRKRRTVKKFKFPKRKTHYRNFKRSHRR